MRSSTRQRVRAFIGAQLDALDLDGRSLCLVIPDATRSCPLPLLLDAIQEATEPASVRAPL